MDSLNIWSVLSMIITGSVWGISTPLLKKYSKDIEEVNHSNPLMGSLLQMKAFFTNWKYLLSFLVNQSGSILYTITLSVNPIIIAVPVTNAINFVFVLIGGQLLGETTLDSRQLFGSVLVMIGIVLCLLSQ